jgi:hypothetical protein
VLRGFAVSAMGAFGAELRFEEGVGNMKRSALIRGGARASGGGQEGAKGANWGNALR